MKKFTMDSTKEGSWNTSIGDTIYSDDDTWIIITDIVKITVNDEDIIIEGYGMPVL